MGFIKISDVFYKTRRERLGASQSKEMIDVREQGKADY